jgi:DMSO/TMAO reductase YedYZ molybdopterin-dependent catalytic subunit
VTSTTTQRPAAAAADAPAGRSALGGAVAGLVSLGVFLAVAELAAAVVGPAAAPAVAIGQTAIDAAPHQLKDYAVRTFGTADKPVLLAGVLVVLAVLAALAGVAAARRLRYGLGALALLTVVTAGLAVTRPSGRAADAAPAVLGGLAAAAALTTLRQRRATAEGPEAVSRRALLGYGLAWTAAAAVAGTVGRQLLAGASRATASRRAVVLPPVASAAPAAVGDPQAPGAAPFHTANADFYRVDTALTVPQVDAATWRLRLHGMVDRPVTFTFDQLLAMPLVERDITLTCVSNEVGGPYVGTARWTGVPLGPLLEAAGLQPGATQLLSRSVDGWTCGTPVEVVTDGRDALLAVAMNGSPLPLEHGFPVRMVVPGLYGYVSATKWLTDLEVTTFEKKAYWATRGYAEQAPIKVSSRIDTPKPFAPVKHGRVAVAGVAWAQHTGIAKVEVSVDGGPWQAARLAGEDGVDTWRQWVFPWDATPGAHRLSVRATDKAGRLQDAVRRPVYPDGATGRQELVVTVT